MLNSWPFIAFSRFSGLRSWPYCTPILIRGILGGQIQKWNNCCCLSSPLALQWGFSFHAIVYNCWTICIKTEEMLKASFYFSMLYHCDLTSPQFQKQVADWNYCGTLSLILKLSASICLRCHWFYYSWEKKGHENETSVFVARFLRVYSFTEKSLFLSQKKAI